MNGAGVANVDQEDRFKCKGVDFCLIFRKYF